jgi:hypothetical protein
MGFLARCPMQALLDLEVIRMEFLFLPPVAERAFVFMLAAIFVRRDEVLGMPIGAHLFLVLENGRFSPVVLPVVGIDAHVPLVVVFSVGTPYCLEVENVEIHIWLKLLNQFD